MSKATTRPTKLGGSKRRWLFNKIKLTWEENTVFHRKEWWIDSLFILFPGLFYIIVQSAIRSAIPFYWMYLEVVSRRVLCEFLHLGILSSTEKGTKQAHQPNLAVMGLNCASRIDPFLAIYLSWKSCGSLIWDPSLKLSWVGSLHYKPESGSDSRTSLSFKRC